jgi:hypothetical protein
MLIELNLVLQKNVGACTPAPADWFSCHLGANPFFSTGVHVEVVFGSPAKNCRGAGICMIIDSARMPPGGYPCPHTRALLYPTAGGRPALRFESAGLKENKVKCLLATPFFIVEEMYRIPGYLLRGMGWRAPFFIAPGRYPTTVCPDGVEIVF